MLTIKSLQTILLNISTSIVAGYIGGAMYVTTHQSPLQKTNISIPISPPKENILPQITNDIDTSSKDIITSEPINSLEEKVGFKYNYDIQDYQKILGTEQLPDLGMFFKKIGKNYIFKIDKFIDPYETLIILYSAGEILPSSSVTIYDRNNDNIPDQVDLDDWKNNTHIHIKNKNGTLEYEHHILTEKIAKDLFTTFSQKYIDFYKEHHIDDRIRAYEPRLEIKDIELNEPATKI